MRSLRRSPFRRFVRDTRGATIVEYSLLLVLILVTAAPVLASLGKKVNAALNTAIAAFGD
jgi:Flp pilus assembly pilin Flp